MMIDLAKKRGIKYHFPMKLCCSGIFSILLTLSLLFFMQEKAADAETCTPTPEDQMGPFYKPNAPMRSSVGKGYVLQGIVRSSKDCGPLPGAVIEFWLAGPDGGYDDAHRATVIADASGKYRFESAFPPPYYGRPPHIHLRISAKGYVSLVTQYYPAAGKKDAVFDIVLLPSR